MKPQYLYALLPALLVAGTAQADYPMVNIAADKVIAKYQNATCEQLWEQKGQPKTDEEQNVIQILHDDPQVRTVFLDKIAAPVVNKLFECGLIP
ncbi:MAG TPA: hypothetical protein PKW44_05250 [Methylophilaceae bacterium]|nr:hypothetical protein [Methylophilaceae bacterium]